MTCANEAMRNRIAQFYSVTSHTFIHKSSEPCCPSRRTSSLLGGQYSAPDSRTAEDRRLSWPGWLVTYRHGTPVRRQPPIPVITGPDVRQLRWCDRRRYVYAAYREYLSVYPAVSERGDLAVLRTAAELGKRSFLVADPVIRKSLPEHLRSPPSAKDRFGVGLA